MDPITVSKARRTESIGKQVRVQGWVRTRRDSKGGFSFIELNDGSCQSNLQIVAPGTLANYESDDRNILVLFCDCKDVIQEGRVRIIPIRWVYEYFVSTPIGLSFVNFNNMFNTSDMKTEDPIDEKLDKFFKKEDQLTPEKQPGHIFHELKRFRAIATRYEKTARNYLALVHLACARLWLES